MNTYIFDLDGTLYQDGGRAERRCDEKVGEFFMKRLNINAEEAQKLREDILRQYHWEAEVVETRFGIDEKEFMDYICDVDVSHLPQNPELNELLHKLSARKLVYSDSTMGHVCDTLCQIAVDEDVFERIFVAEHNGFRFKFLSEAFINFCKICQVDAQDAIIFEDSLRNIKSAKEIGMTTVLISPEAKDAPDADYQFTSLNEALKYFMKF